MLHALLPVAQRFYDAGFKLYIVGGSVRNPLLQLPASDLDVCGPARVEQVIDIFKDSDVTIVPRAVEFGTLEIHFTYENTKYMAEYTTFRCDSYRNGHRPDTVHFTSDIKVDARRRDFRVNALYQNAMTGEIVDPTGGIFDLVARRLCTVTDDPAIIIRDDGLRIMRMVRFAAQLGFEIDHNLFYCAKNYVALLADIACERLRDEIEKIFLADCRYPQLKLRGTDSFFRALTHLEDLGAIPYLFGDLQVDKGIIWDCIKKFSTNAQSTTVVKMRSLSNFIDKPSLLALRLAFYLHKNDCASIRNQLVSLRFSTEMCNKVVDFVDNFHSIGDNFSDFAFLASMSEQNAAATILHLILIDEKELASDIFDRREALKAQNAPKSISDLQVNGNDLLPLLGEKPRKLMTPLLKAIYAYAVNNPYNKDGDSLLSFAQAFIASGELGNF